MLTVNYPKINYSINKSMYEKSVKEQTSPDEKPAYKGSNSVSFGADLFPTKKTSYLLRKFHATVIDPAVKTLYILPHKKPDSDAIGSALALGEIIEQKTGKVVKIFVTEPLTGTLKHLDKKDKVIVISNILGKNATVEDIVKKFGQPDVSIAVDTAETHLFEEPLFNAFVKKSETTGPKVQSFKIDHHNNLKTPEYNYADVSIVSPEKSTAQIIEQLIGVFGIKQNEITPDLRTYLTRAILGDTGNLAFADYTALRNLAALNKYSEAKNPLESSIKASTMTTAAKAKAKSLMLSNFKTSENGAIASFILDVNELPKEIHPNEVKELTAEALNELQRIQGAKYFYNVVYDSNNPQKVDASIRTIDGVPSPLSEIEKLGGGGRPFACGLHNEPGKIEMTPNEMSNKIHEILSSL